MHLYGVNAGFGHIERSYLCIPIGFVSYGLGSHFVLLEMKGTVRCTWTILFIRTYKYLVLPQRQRQCMLQCHYPTHMVLWLLRHMVWSLCLSFVLASHECFCVCYFFLQFIISETLHVYVTKCHCLILSQHSVDEHEAGLVPRNVVLKWLFIFTFSLTHESNIKVMK